MTDERDTESDRSDPPQMPTRRPWHPPQFYLTEVASTYLQGGTITDGIAGNLT